MKQEIIEVNLASMRDDPTSYLPLAITFTLAKLGLLDGYEFSYDEDSQKHEHTINGPSNSWNLYFDLEFYWKEHARTESK